MSKTLIKLGRTKGQRPESIYLYDFSWDCNWYWGGGYLGNRDCHFHFDGAFLDVPDRRGHPLGRFITPWDEKKLGDVVVSNGCSVWEDIETFLDDVPEVVSKNWWRIKDLFKQFYAIQSAAEVFRHGGHCTPKDRTDGEIRKDMELELNRHIRDVIIPCVYEAIGLGGRKVPFAKELKEGQEVAS